MYLFLPCLLLPLLFKDLGYLLILINAVITITTIYCMLFICATSAKCYISINSLKLHNSPEVNIVMRPIIQRRKWRQKPTVNQQRARARIWTWQCQTKCSWHRRIKYVFHRTSGAICFSNSLTCRIIFVCFITYENKQRICEFMEWSKVKKNTLFNKKLFKSTIYFFNKKKL